MTAKNVFGFDRLMAHAINDIADEMSFICADARGDSEIERLLLSAIILRMKYGFSEYSSWLVEMADEFDHPETRGHELVLFIKPQAQLPFGRVDFLIRAFNQKQKKWQSLIVECDGHDFHERTKEQASRDKSRDRAAMMGGYQCFRFTGSEIWKNAWGCAEEVLTWATKDWGEGNRWLG